MKINILSGCVLAASMLLTTSCSDFLTEDPKGQLTNETLFKTKADLDLAVNSLYSNIGLPVQLQHYDRTVYG